MAAKTTGLHTAHSLESTDTQALNLAFDGPPSRKRKAPYTDSSVLALKRNCDSPLDSYDASNYGCSQTEAAWDSPVKDIDLSASDSLEDDFDLDEDEKQSQPSICSSSRSEGWTFPLRSVAEKRAGSVELAGIDDEPLNMSSSPTKTGDFVPVSLPPHSAVAVAAYQYSFSPLVVSVGATYFQRLAAADHRLKLAAQSCADFAFLVAKLPDMPAGARKSVGAPVHQCQTPRHWLYAVFLACVYVAAKNLEAVPYKHLLRTMLQQVHGPLITAEHAERLEVEVLVALDWRLGPFFLHRSA